MTEGSDSDAEADAHGDAGAEADAETEGETETETDAATAADREEFAHAPVVHASVTAGMSVADLVAEYPKTGIGGRSVAEAADVLAEMFADDVTVFMGLAGAMVPAGMRRIVTDLIRDGHVDVLVTTGATLTHDAIEAIGGKHHHGRATPTDPHPAHDHKEHGHGHDHSHDHGEHGPGSDDEHAPPTEREHDERLREEGVDRIYNVYLPQEHFTAFETHLREEVFPVFEADGDPTEPATGQSAGEGEGTTPSIAAFTRVLGEANARINDRDDVAEAPGIAATAAANDVPVYCPAIQDSVLGLQAWLRSQVAPFSLDALADMSGLNDLAYDADRAGAFVVGGGVPKNFVLQTMLVTPHAYDLGVQLTMDPPQTGGLSGATLDEARSWGKFEPSARTVSVYADATITLPLVVAAARDRHAAADTTADGD